MAAGLLSMLTSCEEEIFEKPSNTYIDNFEYAWKKLDTHYGLFITKNIDWNKVYGDHITQAMQVTNDQQLYDVLGSMVKTLNDKHVNVYTTSKELRDYNSGEGGHIPAQEDIKFDVIEGNYLTEYHVLSEDIGYGVLKSGMGYVHISAFKESLKSFEDNADVILNNLHDAPSIIVDIREHSGGDDRVSKYIAGRFASSKKLFMTTKKKNGPAHDSFEAPVEWYVQPEGGKQFTGPVVLLTSSHSISAAETFTLAMKQNENVIQVGATTAGAFSDQVFFELPNGWFITVSVGDYRAADGTSFEGIGIAPEIEAISKKEELQEGIDKALEAAIETLM